MLNNYYFWEIFKKYKPGKILPCPKYELKFDELCRIYKTFRSAGNCADLFIEELFKESAGSNLSQPLK